MWKSEQSGDILMRIQINKKYWFLALKKVNRHDYDEILLCQFDDDESMNKKMITININEYVILATNL